MLVIITGDEADCSRNHSPTSLRPILSSRWGWREKGILVIRRATMGIIALSSGCLGNLLASNSHIFAKPKPAQRYKRKMAGSRYRADAYKFGKKLIISIAIKRIRYLSSGSNPLTFILHPRPNRARRKGTG